MKKNFTLKQYVLFSWLIAGSIAFVASFILFFAVGYYNYSKTVENTKSILTDKAIKAARRLSAELLITPRGAPESVRLQLQKELNLELKLLTVDNVYSPTKNRIYVRLPIPQLESRFSIEASADSVNLFDHFNFVLLVFCFLLIGIIIVAGLWLQIKFLNRHIIRPVESLVHTSVGDKNASDLWPIEIQEISNKLSSSFKERDQIIYSQIARGVIHDIRTLLQSLQVATDLAVEKQSEDRLKNLLQVSKSKLPSLLGIINTALDGSREINVNAEPNDLTKTLKRSIDTNSALSDSKKIKIQFENSSPSSIVYHDSIQMERVFTNILKNAVEAVDAGKSEEKNIRIVFDHPKDNFAKISIEDNGDGLPEKPENIFRLLKSTKTHGSGLGLLVSRKIVEAHGGRLLASHSKNLKGAKFEIQIPIKPNSEAQL